MKVSFFCVRGNVRAVSIAAKVAKVNIIIKKRKDNDIMI